MLDQAEHNYTVLDPYNEFFGYGDPRMTTTFSEAVPERRGLVVLIIHGAEKEGWHSTTPKAKFVIVNLPFKTISVRKMTLKKRKIEAVYVEEARKLCPVLRRQKVPLRAHGRRDAVRAALSCQRSALDQNQSRSRSCRADTRP